MRDVGLAYLADLLTSLTQQGKEPGQYAKKMSRLNIHGYFLLVTSYTGFIFLE